MSTPLLGSVFVTFLFWAGRAYSECTSLKNGPIVFDVVGCSAVVPEQSFDLQNPQYQWIKDLDSAGRQSLFQSYRGLYIKGKVIKSDVVQSGVSAVPGALKGETILAFVPPGESKCETINGKRFTAQLTEKCCDGSGNAPCLLQTEYVLTKPNVIGTSGSGAGDPTKVRSQQSKDYAAGKKAFGERRYKQAIQFYLSARAKGELDLLGYYHVGYAYREVDQCKEAIPYLKYIHDLDEKNAIWADDEKTARLANFLLARCYARTNRPGPAVLVLNTYLIEPGKFVQEIRDSINHKDFGWIHTSKEYSDYKALALKKLKTVK
jgi:tetratricopeptide (TPR) repeat protein